MNIEKLDDTWEYPYTVRFDKHVSIVQWKEMYVWAEETFGIPARPESKGQQKWTAQWAGIRFKNLEHAQWFILRWTGD